MAGQPPSISIGGSPIAEEALHARLERKGIGTTMEQAQAKTAARAGEEPALDPYGEYVMAWPEGQEGMMTHEEFEKLKLQKAAQYQQNLQQLQAQGSQLTNAQLQALEFAKGVV